MNDDLSLENFCFKIPKVELHAHINGSISRETLKKLIKKHSEYPGWNETSAVIEEGKIVTLEDCFSRFKLVHQIVDSLDALFFATKSVIEDFAADNVKYLELRSTPKCIGSTSKADYIETVLAVIDQANKDANFDIQTNFLVSIDRRNGLEVANETVTLAEKYRAASEYVVGLDLSGDPAFGKSSDFVPALTRAGQCGLRTAVHLAEVRDEHAGMKALLDTSPDRIGHGTCLLPELGGSQDLVDFVVEKKIPLELCLTSNVKGQTVKSFADHHFYSWYDKRHPCVLCTDDKGVFETSLSHEYEIAAKTFNLRKIDLMKLSEKAIDCSFAPQTVKNSLKTTWERQRAKFIANEADFRMSDDEF